MPHARRQPLRCLNGAAPTPPPVLSLFNASSVTKALQESDHAFLGLSPFRASPVGINSSGDTATATPVAAPSCANQTDGLPRVAILAGSRGGRLVASGITIAGDRGGGGFNVKLAKLAAREASRHAAVAKELSKDESHQGSRGRTTAPMSGRPPHGNVQQVGRAHGKEAGKASSWGWGRGRESVKNSRKGVSQGVRRVCAAWDRGATNVSGSMQGGTGGGAHSSSGSFAPASGGAVSAGTVSSGGGSGDGTDGSTSVAMAGDVVSAKQTTRGLNVDSVVWAPSRRVSRSSPSSRGRRDDGSGQGETIRRLVHMGMF